MGGRGEEEKKRRMMEVRMVGEVLDVRGGRVRLGGDEGFGCVDDGKVEGREKWNHDSSNSAPLMEFRCVNGVVLVA